MKLLLHPISQKRYDSIVANPPQGILLVAPAGSGKETTLRTLAKDILGANPIGRLFEIVPMVDKNSISIDAIRNLKMSLRLKSNDKRVVLIPQAGTLTLEAQNSLLKLLEEPPQGVHFLLAVNTSGEVLDTIQSRTSIWRLTPPAYQQLLKYYNNYPENTLKKALAIGESRVGLISALLQEEANHPLLQAIETAKEILGEDHFRRLIRVEPLTKDQPQAKLLLEATELVCKAALENAATKKSHTVQQWSRRLKQVSSCQEYLDMNIQPKLVFGYLFMVL